MKNVSYFLTLLLLGRFNMVHSGELIPFQLLEENKFITDLKKETDPVKKENLINGLSKKCPFKEDQSDLAALIPASLTLSLAANLPDTKKAECGEYLQGINSSIENTKKMQSLLSNPEAKLDDSTKERLEANLKNTMAGTSGLHSLLQAQCASNDDSSTSRTSNHLINAVENGSNALAYVNPIAALIGAGAAATGRLVVGLSDWLFSSPKKDLAAEVKDSERFVSDLCAFRDLTQKYDKISSDPIDQSVKVKSNKEKDKEKEKEMAERKKNIDLEMAATKQLLACTENLKSSVDKLQIFSQEIGALVENQSSQRQCLNLLNKYIDTKSGSETSPLAALASRYGCFSPEGQGVTGRYGSYCKNFAQVEEMAAGDIYEKCESESFQKSANTKFINLSDLVFRNIEEDMKTLAPINEKLKRVQASSDELQQMREADNKEKIAQEKFNSAGALLDINPITNSNTLKAMNFLGRNLLGPRFDSFASNSLKSAKDEIKEAADVLSDVVDQKKKIDGKKFFSFRTYNDSEKEKIQKEICANASQVKRQLINGYRSNAGIKDICDFTAGDGVPPLKSPGINYDTYSAPLSDQEKNLTNRCKKINEQVTENFTEIKKQLTAISELGCGL